MSRWADRWQPARPWALALVAAVVWTGAPTARAQERGDTGRHLPPPPPPRKVEAPVTPVTPQFTAGGDRWLAGFGFGSIDGGDLFRVQTAGGAAVPWGPPDNPRFTASRFTTKVDPGSAFSAYVSRRLGDGRWWLRTELSRGASDVAAEALLGQGGEIFRYDRLTFLSATLSAEARLTAWPSHPYAAAGLSVCRITADLADGLDQTGAGFQAAVGYRQRVGKAYLALESQLRRIAIDIKDFRPSVATGSEPEVVYAPSDDLWLLEIRLIACRAW